MSLVFSVSWNDTKSGSKKGPLLRAVAAGVLALSFLPQAAHASASSGFGDAISVIVRELPGAGDTPERAVRSFGGEVVRQVGVINGFVAKVPQGAVSLLRSSPSIHSITPDGTVQLLHDVGGFDGDKDPTSMYHVAQEEMGAGEYWNDMITGAGVDVAIIDSGVVPVDGLTAPDKVINGPDLSFDSQVSSLRHLDAYGHGTHLAGIIAGKDLAAPAVVQKGDHDSFVGVAPGARIVNVKVADAQGSADVSQVIAAIDWVVQHRNSNGMNIRVLNLSFGTDGVQSYLLDPLSYAAEVAWRKGIVVVVAAGNRGSLPHRLNNPAYDPYLLAVGASATDGVYGITGDTIPEWSSRGDGERNPDVVAPGKSLVGLRAPGSYLDEMYSGARVASRFFRGSGTSQSAAMVSGAAALIIQQRPSITPDQVKRLLKLSANRVPNVGSLAQGAGQIDLKKLRDMETPSYKQAWPVAIGEGSLELSRGSAHLYQGGAELFGEKDIFGAAWNPQTWSRDSWAGKSWSDGVFNGNSWSGNSWSGVSWSGVSWSGVSWSGNSWSGVSWSGVSWSGVSWSGNSWSGVSWSGVSWSGVSWSGVSWSGNSWSSCGWSAVLWS